jgi:hypothetical protein
LPGPLRQLVFTDTLINGISGVGVNIGLGVTVTVGVNVGGSGVKEEVGVKVNKVAVGAFRVSPAITVSAMTVLRATVSGVTTVAGPAHAMLAISNIASGK